MVGIDSNRLYVLNGTGTRIWQELSEPRTLAHLVESLRAHHAVAEAAARDDCHRFCDDLLKKGLLDCVE
ncbi:MAG TPA: PqqD family protein [Polyangia bacterium]